MNRDEVEVHLSKRSGRVLGKDTIVKEDQYVPVHYLDSNCASEQILLSGAPNYRRTKIAGCSIYGVGQPSVFGIRAVLNVIKVISGQASPKVLWINLREEPVVYLNDRPFVLRESDYALKNLPIYSGVSGQTLSEMEARLTEDILEVASNNNGMFIVHNETEDQRVIPCWEAVSKSSLKTPKEVYDGLEKDGYAIQYERVPVSPEGKFHKSSVDLLVSLLRGVNSDTNVVFNCQMGLGRSTMAMVIASLLMMTPNAPLDSLSSSPSAPKRDFSLDDSDLATYHRGEYPSVLHLVRTFENGHYVKEAVDWAIDKCGVFQNLREAILTWKTKSDLSTEVDRALDDATVVTQKAIGALERYLSLISIKAYIDEERPTAFRKTFEQWFKGRAEIYTIIKSIHKQSTDQALTITHNRSSNSADTAVMNRNGNVLVRGSILKVDHFPSMRTNGVEGAPNFRKVKGAEIYACAVPTNQGIINVLNNISAQVYPKEFVWVNLREEPVIYVNKLPLVLRHRDKPLRNITIYSGISGDQLEKMEIRLKEDILTEVRANHGKLMVHDESSSHQLLPSWITIETVETPREVYENLIRSGFRVSYIRIPVTTEQSPEIRDFDELLHLIIRPEHREKKIIFNCQIGRGRSTTGTIMAYLIQYWMGKKGVVLPSYDPPQKTDFAITTALVRLLRDGQQTKRQTDYAIDQCAYSQNLRLTILSFISRREAARTPEEVKQYVSRAASYLQRYYWLIVFNAFLSETATHGFQKSFEDWLREREEITTLFETLEHSPEKAIMMTKVGKIDRTDPKTVVKARHGNVLSGSTIIKYDHFPGCQRKGLDIIIDGAPNFRKVDGLQVYGVAIPTTDGVQNVLKQLGAQAGGLGKVLWINLREEPIVYVNGRPFVVRSEARAFENLEHSGIDTHRIEQMEDRLRQDLCDEAKEYDGTLVIHDENDAGELMPHFEAVSSDDCILTPRQVYNKLKSDGFQVEYQRVGVTDEQSPTTADFVDILNLISSADPNTHYIFNCQMGRGRTTTGMVIACMYKRWMNPQYTILKSPQVDSRATGPIVEWKVIARLVRTLRDGAKNKVEADACIDMCSVMQNLRDAIKSLKLQVGEMADAEKKKHLHERAVNYLKRYYYLILFCAYLHDTLPTEGLPTPFYQWLSNRQEVSSLLQRTTLEEVPAGITSMPLTATSSPNIGLSSHSALPAGYGAENEHLPISRSDNTLEVPKGK